LDREAAGALLRMGALPAATRPSRWAARPDTRGPETPHARGLTRPGGPQPDSVPAPTAGPGSPPRRAQPARRAQPLSPPARPAPERAQNRAEVLRELPSAGGASVLLTTHLGPSPPSAPLPDGLLPPDKEQRLRGPALPGRRTQPPGTAGSRPAFRGLSLLSAHAPRRRVPPLPLPREKKRGAKKNPGCASAHARPPGVTCVLITHMRSAAACACVVCGDLLRRAYKAAGAPGPR